MICKGFGRIFRESIKYGYIRISCTLICVFSGVKKGSYFGGETVGRTEVEVML